MTTRRQKPADLMSDSHSVLDVLKNTDIFSFVQFYLTRRYEGLFSPDLSFPDTCSFVSELLIGLRDKGLTEITGSVFNCQMRLRFDHMYQKVIDHRFDFDAKVMLAILQRLPLRASVLDFGAGNNHFLQAMSRCVARPDISYFASDYFVSEIAPNGGGVQWIKQPGPYELPPHDSPFDLILLRRTAHHILDFRRLIPKLYAAMSAASHLTLIEDSFSENELELWSEITPLVDKELTATFHRSLSNREKINFLQFNDFYTNYLYHSWTNMPLPLKHKSCSEWKELFFDTGFDLAETYNLGFPKTGLNLHQSATMVFCWTKKF
jgi:hypothetical protein